jgi:hypothetical protein
LGVLSDERTCLQFAVQSVGGESRGGLITVSPETTGFPFRRLLRLAEITAEVFLPASARVKHVVKDSENQNTIKRRADGNITCNTHKTHGTVGFGPEVGPQWEARVLTTTAETANVFWPCRHKPQPVGHGSQHRRRLSCLSASRPPLWWTGLKTVASQCVSLRYPVVVTTQLCGRSCTRTQDSLCEHT